MSHTMTRLDEEREAQKSWRLKRPQAASVIELMLRREFLTPSEARNLEAGELRNIVRFAKSEVPFVIYKWSFFNKHI